jgi:DNA-binding SARP family transcriptional activator/5'-deoxynucleotidase YfbR-like HD superfamily hydrolase
VAAAEMAFSLLGPLSVRVDGAPVRVPMGKQRVLLAALLLHAGRTVTADQLAELLWARDLPPSAAVTMQNYVKRLRQTFGNGRHRIVTQPGGYLIRVHPGELDINAMEGALADAHDAARARAWPDAARHADAALGYWRGNPLCDITSAWAFAQEASRLTELRVQARELRIEAGLQLGEHARMIPEARQRVAEEPLREHTHALLMRALHGSGRTAESLQAYQSARRTLVEELGCEPGPELQALHQKMLDDTCAPPASSGSNRNADSSARLPIPGEADHPLAGVAAFLLEMGHLKRVPRSGWLPFEVPQPETIAEHSFRASIIGMALAALESADVGRTSALCLLHGEHETRIGDVPWAAPAHVMTAGPQAVFGQQTAGMPDAAVKAFLDLTSEFEAGETIEAQVARDADKLDTLLQAVEHQAQGHDTIVWQETVIAALRTDSAKQLAQAISSALPHWSRAAPLVVSVPGLAPRGYYLSAE